MQQRAAYAWQVVPGVVHVTGDSVKTLASAASSIVHSQLLNIFSCNIVNSNLLSFICFDVIYKRISKQ